MSLITVTVTHDVYGTYCTYNVEAVSITEAVEKARQLFYKEWCGSDQTALLSVTVKENKPNG